MKVGFGKLEKVKHAVYFKKGRNQLVVQLLSFPRRYWETRKPICKNQYSKETSNRLSGVVKCKSNQTHLIFLFDRKQVLWMEKDMSNVSFS